MPESKPNWKSSLSSEGHAVGEALNEATRIAANSTFGTFLLNKPGVTNTPSGPGGSGDRAKWAKGPLKNYTTLVIAVMQEIMRERELNKSRR